VVAMTSRVAYAKHATATREIKTESSKIAKKDSRTIMIKYTNALIASEFDDIEGKKSCHRERDADGQVLSDAAP
jgi:hypothetical protein